MSDNCIMQMAEMTAYNAWYGTRLKYRGLEHSVNDDDGCHIGSGAEAENNQ